MFAFANIRFSDKAKAAAKADGKAPDEFYVFELLKEKGIVAVSGGGFG
jgi:alanine transaminase